MLEAWRLIGRGQSATLIEISTRSRWILPFLFDPQGILLPRTIILRYYILNHSSPRQRFAFNENTIVPLSWFPSFSRRYCFQLSCSMNSFFFLDQIIDYWLFLIFFGFRSVWNDKDVVSRLFTKYFQIYSNILSRNTFVSKNCFWIFNICIFCLNKNICNYNIHILIQI